jgi:hypothetical protein
MSLRKVSLSVAAVLLVFAATGSPALAQVTLPDLPPGSQYQIVFVTDVTTTAVTPGESYYNNFVTTWAAPITALLPAGTTWSAITSTYDSPGVYTNASDNAPAYANIPIYNTQGQLVASGAAQFYSDNETLFNPPDRDVSGAIITTHPWTGSQEDGLVDIGDAIGGVNPEFGLDFSDDTWLQAGAADEFDLNLGAFKLSLYALSSPITIPDVPEPASLTLSAVSAAGLLTRGARHGRRQIA